jgi:hypothetical protein
MNVGKNRRLAERIAGCLRKGIAAEGGLIDYIDALFVNAATGDIERVLADEDDCEREPLLDLIFFPDPSLQGRIEDILEAHDFGIEDETAVAAMLHVEVPGVALAFRGGRTFVPFPLWAAEHFVRRLRITFRLDSGLKGTIEKRFPDGEAATACKVSLRNAGVAQAGPSAGFLTLFFERMTPNDPGFPRCFDFVLGFIGELSPDADPFEFLMAKKRFHHRNLLRALKAEELLRKDNMETLMMNGVRFSHASREESADGMEMIDRIARSLFGKTEHLGPPPDGADPSELIEAGDFEAVFRMFGS